MALRWIGPPPTRAELAQLARLAKAGKLPRNGTARRANPAQARRALAAEDAYREFHWGEAPRRVRRVRLPDFRELFELGHLRAVEYETVKGGERAIWVHKFSRPFPSLTATPAGRLGPIVGGIAHVTERGIEK